MQTVADRPSTFTPRWVLLAAMGLFGLFVGIGIKQVVVQAATFDDPGCNPSSAGGPAACNKSAPLFLHPADLNATQVVDTPVQIGQTGANAKDLSIFGNLTLSEPGKKIQTAASYTGTVIDFLTTASTPVMIVNNNGTGAGIQATATNGNALFARSDGTGNAALFEGPVAIQGASGNLTVTGTLTVGGVQVGTTGDKIKDQGSTEPIYFKTIDIPVASGATIDYDLGAADFGNLGANFKVVGFDAMYDADNTGPNTYFRSTDNTTSNVLVEYQECKNSLFFGHMNIVNNTGSATIVRLNLRYHALTSSLDCGPSFTLAVSPSGGIATRAAAPPNPAITGTTYTFTPTTDWSKVNTIKWDFIPSLDVCTVSSLDPLTTCPTNYSYGTIVSGTAREPTVIFPTGYIGAKTVKLTLTNDAGSTFKTIDITNYDVNILVSQVAGQASPYPVKLTDSTTLTGSKCKVYNGTIFDTGEVNNCTIPSVITTHDTAGSFTATAQILDPGCNYNNANPSLGICDSKLVNYTIANQCDAGFSLCPVGGSLCCPVAQGCCEFGYNGCTDGKPSFSSAACKPAACNCINQY